MRIGQKLWILYQWEIFGGVRIFFTQTLNVSFAECRNFGRMSYSKHEKVSNIHVSYFFRNAANILKNIVS